MDFWNRRFGGGARPAPMVCRMLFDELCVLANGEIVCSCGDPAGLRVFGNVHRDRIEEVFNGRGYRSARRWQLSAPPGSYCPVIRAPCGGRTSRACPSDREAGRTVKTLQLEPVSVCNLQCPGCPVGNFARDRNYRANRRALLPLPAMLALLDQLPDLEKLLFYNFGEPFLHPGAVDFLRAVRSRRPDVTVQTSTNGLALDRGKIEAIVREGLLDRIVLSIDGATEESYGRYRVGGDFLTAISALEQLARARRSRGGAPRPEIHWQYILFEWNDSDEEIALARATAARIGVELKFVLTHTPGASRLYRDGTAETARLFAGTDPFQALTCDARRDHLWKHGGASSGFRLARIEPEELEIAGGCGSRRSFGVRVSNTSGAPWVPGPGSRFRLGVRLRTATGRLLRELAGPDLPERCLLPGGTGTVAVDLLFPDGSGNYELFLDVVEEGICWFSERSSPPATVRLAVRGGGRGEAVLAASPPA